MEKLNFTHQRWINGVLVAFLSTAFLLVLWVETWRMGIKEQEDEEGMQRGDGAREKNWMKGWWREEKKWGRRISTNSCDM